MLINNLIREFNEKINIKDEQVLCNNCDTVFENQYEFNKHMLDTDCFHYKGKVCRECLKSDFHLRERVRKLERELAEKKEYIKILETALINPGKKSGKREVIPACVRQNLWFIYFGKERMIGYCTCCGREVSYHNFHVSHKIPVRDNGSNCIDNLTICCANCNLSMADRNFFEFKNAYYPDA